jgi:hypothetical protein
MFVLSLSKNKVDQEVNQDLQMLVTKVIIVMQVEVEVLERYKMSQLENLQQKLINEQVTI